MDRTRALLAAAAAPVLVLALAGPAAAHVTITPSTTAAGADAVLAVRVPHGCDGSATTAVTIRIPDGVDAVRPVDDPSWQHDTEPGQVTYRAVTPLSDGDEAVVELAVRLPDTAGVSLVFATIQTCERGEVAWIEVAEPGQDPEELDRPAPVVLVAGAPSTDDVPAAAYAALGVGVLGVLGWVAYVARQRRRS